MTVLPALNRFLEAAAAAQKWRVLRPLERSLQKSMSKAFAKQGKLFLEGFADLAPLFESHAYRESIAMADWLHVFDAAAKASYSAFLEPLEATAATGLMAGATASIAQLGLESAFNLRNPRAVQYINVHGAQNVAGINQTTKDQLRTLMSQAVEEGWSYQQTARQINRTFAGFAGSAPQEHIRNRAELVAITEAGEAYETGNEIPVRDLVDAGLKMEKSWLTVGDDRVSEGCRDNAAQGWIPFAEAFSSGHMRPLRFPGCRCGALYQRASS